MTKFDARWFVLPPTQDLEAWRLAMRHHAEAQGLSVVEVVTGNELVTAGDIVLSSDLDLARLAGASSENTTVLDLSPFVDLSDCREEDHPFRILDLTRKIAAARDFEGEVSSPDMTLPPPFSALRRVAGNGRTPTALEAHFLDALAIVRHDSAEWAPEVFRYGAGPAGSARPGVLDITGRPRLVVYGPYIFLTRGVWRVTVRLGFDVDSALKQYQIQWGDSEAYASHHFSPGRSGIFEITLEQEWLTHAASEVRLLLEDGAFHGQLTWLGATVSRVR